MSTRAVVVGLGVLASLALMAAPSSAAKGGNSANAKLCETESAALVAQDGSHFKNAGACTSYAAKGGVLAKLEVRLAHEAHCAGFSLPCISLAMTGFGLKPGSEAEASMSGNGESAGITRLVDAHGAVNALVPEVGLNCPNSVTASGTGTLASGLPIKAVVTGTTSC
jgi:hypothetical protein